LSYLHRGNSNSIYMVPQGILENSLMRL
jgi:hypothetical protein